MTEAIERLIRMANAEAESIMDCYTSAEGEWDDETNARAEYERMCAVIADARSELAGLQERLEAAERERVSTDEECQRLQVRLGNEIKERECYRKAWIALGDISAKNEQGRIEVKAQRDRLAEAARIALDVFAPRSDPSPDAEAENAAWDKLNEALAAIDTENSNS